MTREDKCRKIKEHLDFYQKNISPDEIGEAIAIEVDRAMRFCIRMGWPVNGRIHN
jgi:hypothetical protein